MSVEQKAVELLDNIENIIVNYTPEVYETAVNVVWVDAIGNLICILAYFLLSFFAGFLVYKIPAIYDKYDIEPTSVDLFVVPMMLILGAVSLITFIKGFSDLFNAWMWIGIFNPELALAHKVMGL